MGNPRYLHTVYCDDVRQEVGGKTVQFGIYGDRMGITVDEEYLKKNKGVAIPKLCLVTTLSSPVSKPMKKVTFSINLNGQSIVGFKTEAAPLPEDTDFKCQTINSVNAVSLVIRRSSVLNVSVRIGRQLIEGPELKIDLNVRKDGQLVRVPPVDTSSEAGISVEAESSKMKSDEEKNQRLSWLGRR